MVKEINNPTVELSLETLIRECSLDLKPKNEIFSDFSFAVRRKIQEVFKYHKFGYDFSDQLTCYNDGEHIIGRIRPSYQNFLEKLLLFLGVEDNNIEDDIFLTKRLLERIEILKRIQTEKELKDSFPYLYNDLMQGRKFIHDVGQLKTDTLEDKEKQNQLEKYYYASGLKRSLSNFINTQSEVYSRFVLKRKDYKKLVESTSFNSYISKNLDINKIAMYTVYLYLNICEKTEDQEEFQRYYNYVKLYEQSSYNKNVSLTTDDGVVLNEDMLKLRIRMLDGRFPRKKETVNWILVPEGHDYSKVLQKNDSKMMKLSQSEVNRLRVIGEKKQEFYENSPYLAKVIGLRHYNGYVGYIYSNGEVILDREYNPLSYSSALGDAIYNIKVVDFDFLSRLDKTTLKNTDGVKRIIHSKNWQSKVQTVINKEATEESICDAKKLIKRLQEKDNS